jgi:glycosyltransferase involved in cell wall biosynthesis
MTAESRPLESPRAAGVSIVIPTFNEEAAIEATLRQFDGWKDRFTLQTVVSDDASEDRTVAIAEGLADVVVRNATGRRGRSGALNRGAGFATYDNLVFLDADIRIEPLQAFLEEMYREFAGRPDVGGGIMDFAVYPAVATCADRATHVLWSGVQRLVLRAFGIGFPTPGFQMAKREWFERMGGYDERVGVSQDIHYSLRLGRISRFHYFRSARVLESPRRYRHEGYVAYTYRSALRWVSMLLFRRSYGEYRPAR